MWVIDTLKRDKENVKVFHCSYIAVISEICRISRSQIFNIKKESIPVLNRGKESIDLDDFHRVQTEFLIFSPEFL